MTEQVDIKAEIDAASAELQQVMAQIQQLDQQQQQLTQRRNTLVQEGLELQGAVKRLQRLDGKQPESQKEGSGQN